MVVRRCAGRGGMWWHICAFWVVDLPQTPVHHQTFLLKRGVEGCIGSWIGGGGELGEKGRDGRSYVRFSLRGAPTVMLDYEGVV